MPYTVRQMREAFHLLFLERLLKLSDPRLYVLKGGANLRFFYNSPRYSEDMDIDVLGGSVATLKKNGYRVLNDQGFRRSLAAFGIVDVAANDPSRAKHTATTQRFRARLVTVAGEVWPTKVEFSRRQQPGSARSILIGDTSPAIGRTYRRLAFRCQHYSGKAAALQKLSALAQRPEPQVRDAFDLHVLWLGGHWDDEVLSLLPGNARKTAVDVLLAFTYAEYVNHVVDYLEPDARDDYAGVERWDDICATLLELLDRGNP